MASHDMVKHNVHDGVVDKGCLLSECGMCGTWISHRIVSGQVRLGWNVAKCLLVLREAFTKGSDDMLTSSPILLFSVTFQDGFILFLAFRGRYHFVVGIFLFPLDGLIVHHRR